MVSGQVLTALEETRKIADLAKKYDIKHVVKLSAYHIDDKPGYVLGRAHLAAEEYIRCDHTHTHTRTHTRMVALE